MLEFIYIAPIADFRRILKLNEQRGKWSNVRVKVAV